MMVDLYSGLGKVYAAFGNDKHVSAHGNQDYLGTLLVILTLFQDTDAYKKGNTKHIYQINDLKRSSNVTLYVIGKPDSNMAGAGTIDAPDPSGAGIGASGGKVAAVTTASMHTWHPMTPSTQSSPTEKWRMISTTSLSTHITTHKQQKARFSLILPPFPKSQLLIPIPTTLRICLISYAYHTLTITTASIPPPMRDVLHTPPIPAIRLGTAALSR